MECICNYADLMNYIEGKLHSHYFLGSSIFAQIKREAVKNRDRQFLTRNDEWRMAHVT